MHDRTQRRTLALLSIAQVFSGIAFGAVLSVGSLLAVELAHSEAWAGTMSTVLTLGAAFASLPLASLAQRRGRRVALSGGLALATLGCVVVIVAARLPNFAVLLVGGVLIGVGSAVSLQARFAATDLSGPDRRGRDLSLVVWMTTVGSVAGPNLVGVSASISRALGLPLFAGPFVIATAAMGLAAIVLWAGLRPDPYFESLRIAKPPSGAIPAQGVGPQTPSLALQQPAVASPDVGIRQTILGFARHPFALCGLIAIVAAQTAMVSVMSMTPIHLQSHGASVTIIGLTISLHIAGMFGLSPFFGILADRIGPMSVVLGGLAVVGGATALAGLSGADHAMTGVGLVALGVGWSATMVASSALIADGLPLEIRVSGQGLADMATSLFGAIGGAVAGVVLALGGFPALGAMSAGIALLAAFAVIGIRMHAARPRGTAG